MIAYTRKQRSVSWAARTECGSGALSGSVLQLACFGLQCQLLNIYQFFEFGSCGSIYTIEIGKCCKPEAPPTLHITQHTAAFKPYLMKFIY